MDGEELLEQIIIAFMMHNGKMELLMDTLEELINLVTLSIKNIKMTKLLGNFEINYLIIMLLVK